MSNHISRRNFLRLSALGTSAMMLPSAANAIESPLFAPTKGKKGSVNDTINIGFIGLGQQAINLMNGFITIPDVRIVAGADIYDIKRDRFEQRVNKYYAEHKIKNKYTTYVRYEELLASGTLSQTNTREPAFCAVQRTPASVYAS